MPDFEKIEQLTEDVKDFAITNYEIVKLEATERASTFGSGLMSGVIIGMVGFMFLLVLSLGIGFFISELLGNSYIGFMLLAGFYLLVGLVLYLGRKKMLIEPFRDQIIRSLLSKK